MLSADSVTQSKIAEATTEEGNPLALADMRQYLGLAASQNRVLLSDVVDRFAKAPWGWRPAWETVLLVARLFMAGEIKLVMEGNDLDGPGAIEPLTKEARLRTVSISKRRPTTTPPAKKPAKSTATCLHNCRPMNKTHSSPPSATTCAA